MGLGFGTGLGLDKISWADVWMKFEFKYYIGYDILYIVIVTIFYSVYIGYFKAMKERSIIILHMSRVFLILYFSYWMLKKMLIVYIFWPM